jgi:hypothetical protein
MGIILATRDKAIKKKRKSNNYKSQETSTKNITSSKIQITNKREKVKSHPDSFLSYGIYDFQITKEVREKR